MHKKCCSKPNYTEGTGSSFSMCRSKGCPQPPGVQGSSRKGTTQWRRRCTVKWNQPDIYQYSLIHWDCGAWMTYASILLLSPSFALPNLPIHSSFTSLTISRSASPDVPGPAQGFFPVKGNFFSFALGFYKALRDNCDCYRGYITKVELLKLVQDSK